LYSPSGFLLLKYFNEALTILSVQIFEKSVVSICNAINYTMKKTLLLVVSVIIMGGFTQCRKPVLPDFGDETQKQTITFTTTGGDGEKGDIESEGTGLVFKWDGNNDKVYVYASPETYEEGVQTDFSSGVYCGVLDEITVDPTDAKIATFSGEVEVPTGTNTLRFIHYGRHVAVTNTGDNAGNATVSLATQNGLLSNNDNSVQTLSSRIVASCDMPKNDDNKYTGGKLTPQFSIAYFSFANFTGPTITLSNVENTGINVLPSGEITYVSGATMTLNDKSNSYYLALIPAGERPYIFSDDNYYSIGTKNFAVGKYYHGNGGAAIEVNHLFVDLGLPSGTMWATCNVGAENPEDAGYYISWAETAPKAPGVTYSYATNRYYNSGSFNKYYAGDTYRFLRGIDGDDAATTNWGTDWHTPSADEYRELMNNSYCDWTASTINGKNGYIIKSIVTGYTNRSIFLPNTGIMKNEGTDLGTYGGSYWTRDVNSSEYNYIHAYFLMMLNGGKVINTIGRHNGLLIRAVINLGEIGVGSASPLDGGNW